MLKILFVSIFCISLQAQNVAVRFGRLWDGHKLIPNAVVVVADGKVSKVLENEPVPKGMPSIDMRGYTGLPGLIDSHTHVTYYWGGETETTPLKQPKRHVAVTVYLAQRNAMRALEAGVTTIRDLHASGGADLAMRDLINMSAMIGPRMLVCGGGLGNFSTRPGAADSVAEAAKLTKAVLEGGADWVKVFGSKGGFNNVTGDQTVSFEEMKAVVDTAHAMGHKVAIHSYGPAGARDAIRAGADSLEHATDMDDETIALMVKKGVYYVPTVDHNQYYLENADEVYKFPEGSKENLTNYIQRNFETLKKAVKAGAKIVVGSDAVYNGFGLNMRELNWFVKAGMTNEQALQAATTVPAMMLGMQDRIGHVAEGAFADLVAVEGDPLSDIGVVQNVKWVMKDGKVVVDTRPK